MDVGSSPWFDMKKFNTNLQFLYTVFSNTIIGW